MRWCSALRYPPSSRSFSWRGSASHSWQVAEAQDTEAFCVVELLEVSLGSTYISYMNNRWAQHWVHLCPPWWPISTWSALDTASVNSHLWKWYVSGTCCIVKDMAEGLLDHLNSVQPSFQVEKDGMFRFLDTLLLRKEHSSLTITIYRKSTHTDHYLDFQSCQPTHVKMGLVRCLWQGMKRHQHWEQPADRRTPPFWGPVKEWLSRHEEDPGIHHWMKGALAVVSYTAGISVNSRCQWGHQVGVQKGGHDGHLQVWTVTPLSVDKG